MDTSSRERKEQASKLTALLFKRHESPDPNA